MKLFNILPLIIVAFALGFGCAPSDETVEEKPPVVFQGKMDSRFYGSWKADASGSIYTFNEDGSYKLSGKVKTQGGSFDNNSSGSWLVDGEKLLIKDQNGNVVPYAVELKGKTLSLSLTGSLKNKTVLNKQ